MTCKFCDDTEMTESCQFNEHGKCSGHFECGMCMCMCHFMYDGDRFRTRDGLTFQRITERHYRRID